MTCRNCGYISPSLAAFCTNCGERQEMRPVFRGMAQHAHGTATLDEPRIASQPSASPVSPRQPAVPIDAAPYADFLKRFLAFLIDEALAGLFGLAVYGVMALMGSVFALGGMHARRGVGAGAGLGVGAFFVLLGAVLAFAAYVYYFVKQETSFRQATLGKYLLGMRVTNVSGETISIGQSLGRLFIKNLFSSLFCFIGFFMALFTARKQALHDLAASTLVLQR